MLAGLLLALLIVFTGGYDTVMLNPEMKKNVQDNVQDKDRRHQIDQILKNITKDQKAFLKNTHKPGLKKLENLNMDYSSPKEEFEAVLNSYYTNLEELQKKYLDAELNIRSLTQEEEWNKIMEMVLQQPDKEKHASQIKKMIDRMYSNLLNACENNITNVQNLEKALNLVAKYKTNSTDLTEKMVNMGYKQQEEIRMYNAPRANFEALRAEILTSRSEYMANVVDMRFRLKDLTPEANWKNIAKAINQNLSKAGS